MENIVSGMVLPCGSGVVPESILIDSLDTLQRIVGGHIDVVTTTMGRDDAVIIGYVNDEFMMLEGLDYNYLATALFGREIYGNVAIAWGLSPDGDYDGDNYDLPSGVVSFIKTDLLESVALAYGKATLMNIFCKLAVEGKIADEKEIDFRSEQLALSQTNALWGTDETNGHLDFFIALIQDVLKYIKTLDNTVVDEECYEWAEEIISDLELKRGA